MTQEEIQKLFEEEKFNEKELLSLRENRTIRSRNNEKISYRIEDGKLTIVEHRNINNLKI